MTLLETVPRPVAHSGREKVAQSKLEFTRGSPRRHADLLVVAGDPLRNLGLFQDPEAARRQRVDRATDTIESRFGKGAITRAGAMKPGPDEPPVHPVPRP